jgi:hypothetical protein
MTTDVRKPQINPAATASQGGGQAVGLPQPNIIPPVPASFADFAAVKTYLDSLYAALQN